jgi:hypothetical protein
MRELFNNRRAFLAITWLLTSVLFISGVVGSLPVMQENSVCAEFGTLEFDGEDDDRDEVLRLDFAPFFRNGHFVPPQTWQLSPVLYFDQGNQHGWRSHSGRAPPHC